MKKLISVLCIVLCFLLLPVSVYAAGPAAPVIESQMPDCYMNLGGDGITLFTDASSPDGGKLRYQWYVSDKNSMSGIRAINGATGTVYNVPEKEGVKYYCYAAWNVWQEDLWEQPGESGPVYSRLIRVEFFEAQPEVISIEILEVPKKLEYISGERLDPTGLRVRIWTSDGYIDSKDGKDLELPTKPLITVGEQKIRVGYGGEMDVFYVTVKEAPHTHKYGEWTTTEPTCTKAGQRVRKCSCGKEERVEIPAVEHKWDSGKVTTEPTADKNGEKTFTCTVCKETRLEPIEALGVVSYVSSEATDNSNSQAEESITESSEPSEGSDTDTEPSEAVGIGALIGMYWWVIALIAAAIIIVGLSVTLIIVITRKKK